MGTAHPFFFSLAFLCLFSLICVIFSAIPFYTNPSILVGSWITAFGESIFNFFPPSLSSSNFGYPGKIPMVFGLTSAIPGGILVHAGMSPANAFTLTFTIWLFIAFWGAWKLCILLGVRPWPALLAAFLWFCLPCLRGLSQLSMLGIGASLLPFYFYMTLYVYRQVVFTYEGCAKSCLLFVLYSFIMLIAVLTDGYSFFMYVSGSTLLLVYLLAREKEYRKGILCRMLPLQLLSILVAVCVYKCYMGDLTMPPSPIETFRAHGLDLYSLFFIRKGVCFFADLAGANLQDTRVYFGDGSELYMFWGIPLFILVAIASAILYKKHVLLFPFCILLFLFSLYFALGPSLKINAYIEDPGQIKSLNSMEKKYAPVPTGNAVIYKNIPGFKNTRVTARWAVLAFFSLWLVVVLGLKALPTRTKAFYAFTIFLVVCSILYLPPIMSTLQNGKIKRQYDFFIEENFTKPLAEDLYKDDLVAFLPFGNDFVANIVSSRLNIKTYNTGQDKAMYYALQNWPYDFPYLDVGYLAHYPSMKNFAPLIGDFLLEDKRRVVLLPLLNTDWKSFDDYIRAAKKVTIDTREEQFEELLKLLEDNSKLVVKKRETYYLVRAKN